MNYIMMMLTTKLGLHDKLPLTCTRSGVCCHGNQVHLNPWELYNISMQKNITSREFRDRYCELGGIRLRFDGQKNTSGKSACSQYVENFGCSVHVGRPLACRLYPLGRQIQNDEIHYIHQGNIFPCLNGCPEVAELPQLTVNEYLEGQLADTYEQAQDGYLDLMQNLADIAFTLLLDTGLAASGDTKTLQLWREMGIELPEQLVDRIGNEWIDALMLPEINDISDNPLAFIQIHNDLLQAKAQSKFGSLQTNLELHQASVLIMGVALYLARSIGADPKSLAEHWIDIAKEHGACE